MTAHGNSPHFTGLHENPDRLIGGCGDPDRPGYMSIPTRRGRLERKAAMPRSVTVRGAAYLFMPSMAALRFIAAPSALCPFGRARRVVGS